MNAKVTQQVGRFDPAAFASEYDDEMPDYDDEAENAPRCGEGSP